MPESIGAHYSGDCLKHDSVIDILRQTADKRAHKTLWRATGIPQ
ncbi:hypothetical protein [Dyadobacter sp. CY356]|nr:hypothetical protein [Dyadobacter sp. CY356]